MNGIFLLKENHVLDVIKCQNWKTTETGKNITHITSKIGHKIGDVSFIDFIVKTYLTMHCNI